MNKIQNIKWINFQSSLIFIDSEFLFDISVCIKLYIDKFLEFWNIKLKLGLGLKCSLSKISFKIYPPPFFVSNWVNLESKLSNSIVISEFGTYNVKSNEDQSISFSVKYSNPPIVILTAFGNRKHGSANLINVKKDSFTFRLIHYDGSWEQGEVNYIVIGK